MVREVPHVARGAVPIHRSSPGTGGLLAPSYRVQSASPRTHTVSARVLVSSRAVHCAQPPSASRYQDTVPSARSRCRELLGAASPSPIIFVTASRRVHPRKNDRSSSGCVAASSSLVSSSTQPRGMESGRSWTSTPMGRFAMATTTASPQWEMEQLIPVPGSVGRPWSSGSMTTSRKGTAVRRDTRHANPTLPRTNRSASSGWRNRSARRRSSLRSRDRRRNSSDCPTNEQEWDTTSAVRPLSVSSTYQSWLMHSASINQFTRGG